MPFFQKPAETAEEIEASKPLEISPDEVLKFDEREWYERAYRGDASQLTVRAVVMGSVLGFFLSFSNVYIGLKTGWFLSVALTACILSYAVWNALRASGIVKGEMSILENNCMQSTASSAGYATGNALVTAIPALLLLTITPENPKGVHLPWHVIVMWTLSLAAMGVTLAIPLKRNMINREKLVFPSGTAAAITLQGLYGHGQTALKKARALFMSAGFAALIPVLKDLEIKKGAHGREGLIPSSSNLFDWLPNIHAKGQSFKPSDFNFKFDHGIALVAAGAIIGLRITIWMCISGVVLIYAAGPVALEWQWTNALGKTVAAAAKPSSVWKEIGLWYGAPILIASGLVQFMGQWRTFVRAFDGLFKKAPTENEAVSPYREGDSSNAKPKVDPRDVEVPNSWFISGVLVSGTAIIILARIYFDVPILLGILAVLMTFALGVVSCRVTGESDITPGSAMGSIVQLTYGTLLPQNFAANLMTASITSNSSLASADLLNDLKSGYLLGANPRRQFLAQAAGIFTGSIASVLCFFLLVPDATALTGVDGKDPAFAAPGAQKWKAVAEVFRYGVGNLHPMAQSALRWGLVIGAVLAVAELVAKPKVRKWLPSPTGIGLGLILPFFYPIAMLFGALLAYAAEKKNKAWAEMFVTPIAAGSIAGESIIGVVVATVNNFILN